MTENKQTVSFGRYEWHDPHFLFGLARVKRNGKWGIINTLGQEILPAIYDNIWTLSEKYIHAIKVTYRNEEKVLDIDDLLKENILDGLTYHKTYSVKEIKALFGATRIEVKQNTKTGHLFFTLSTIKGEVASNGIPEKPVVSIVSNVNGRLFYMLHDEKDTGKSFIQKPVMPHAHPNTPEDNVTYAHDHTYSDESSDWRELAEDAFEGDMSNYWNID